MPIDHAHSFGDLYARHHVWLHGVLRRKVGCDHKAEDLAHDTFLKVLVSHATAVLEEPRAFLTTIAQGLVATYWRRTEVERAYVSALEAHGPALSASPEDHAQALDALMQIDAMLANVPPKAARAFLLHQLDGLTHVEIGRELGVSDRMVKKYMAQVMLRLLSADA